MAYAERRERQKGVRYRGIYKAADGSYRSAGTVSQCARTDGAYVSPLASAASPACAGLRQCGRAGYTYDLV